MEEYEVGETGGREQLIKHARRSVTAVRNRPIRTVAVDRTDGRRPADRPKELNVSLATAEQQHTD